MVRQVEIVVNDDKVDVDLVNIGTMKRTQVLNSVPEEKIRQYYQNKILNSKPQIFPPAVRWISKDRTRLLWERPPGYETINYSQARQEALQASRGSSLVFRIPIPWQVYFICFNEDYVINTMYMFFNNKPLSEGNLSVGFAPLNNFYKDAKLCQAVYDEIPEASNLYQMLGNAYDMVWNSGFNEDLHECMDMAFKMNKDENHPLLGPTSFPRKRDAFYQYWSQQSLDDITQTTWPRVFDNAIRLAEDYSTVSNNIRVVQFLMDAQSI